MSFGFGIHAFGEVDWKKRRKLVTGGLDGSRNFLDKAKAMWCPTKVIWYLLTVA